MTPPVPSPPITALTSCIFSTTHPTPTFVLCNVTPCFATISSSIRLVDTVTTMSPFVLLKIKSATRASVHSPLSGTPRSVTTTTLSASPSWAKPISEPVSRTFLHSSSNASGVGSAGRLKLPSGTQ